MNILKKFVIAALALVSLVVATPSRATMYYYDEIYGDFNHSYVSTNWNHYGYDEITFNYTVWSGSYYWFDDSDNSSGGPAHIETEPWAWVQVDWVLHPPANSSLPTLNSSFRPFESTPKPWEFTSTYSTLSDSPAEIDVNTEDVRGMVHAAVIAGDGIPNEAEYYGGYITYTITVHIMVDDLFPRETHTIEIGYFISDDGMFAEGNIPYIE